MNSFNVGDLVLVQLTPGAVGQRATVTDVYGDEYYGVRVEDSGLDTGLSGKFISLIKRNEGQLVTGIVGGSQPVTGEFEQSNEDEEYEDDEDDDDVWLVERDDLTAEQLQELYRIGDDYGCTEDEVNDALDDIFSEDDWTFEDLKDRLGGYLYERQNDEDNDIATESPSELRQNLNEVRAELEAWRGRATSAETTISVQEAEIRRLKLRAEEAEAECVKLKSDLAGRNVCDSGPDKGKQLWRVTNDKAEQWYKERPYVSRSWDIPVMDIVTGRVGVLEGFSYAIDDCPGIIASVRVPDGSVEQWYTSCLIPMEQVLDGIKRHRALDELIHPACLGNAITAVSTGPSIEVTK